MLGESSFQNTAYCRASIGPRGIDEDILDPHSFMGIREYFVVHMQGLKKISNFKFASVTN